MLQQQRDSIAESRWTKRWLTSQSFKKAFAASARLVTTVDGMLDTIVNLGQ